MMRWCIHGELMVLVAVVPKHAQCPAVLLSELPPKSFHGWTVRTLLHKKATSVPGYLWTAKRIMRPHMSISYYTFLSLLHCAILILVLTNK